MAYSNKRVDNDPNLFPPPMSWLVWIENVSWEWDQAKGGYTYTPTGTGKLRHAYDFAGARKAMSWIGTTSKYRAEDQRGKYLCDWAIYEWVDGEWVERFSGLAGQERKDNPISKVRLKKGQKLHPIDLKMEEAAIESVIESIRKTAAAR